MPTLLEVSGPTGIVNVIGTVTVPNTPIGVYVDNGDTLDGSAILGAHFSNLPLSLSDGTVFSGASGVYRLADGRVLFALGNPNFLGGTYGMADDLVAHLTNNPGVTFSTLDLSGVTIGNYRYGGASQDSYYLLDYTPWEAIVCFVRNTLIKTESGEVPVEDLTAGDMVLTMDHGYQPIRWIGSSKRRAIGDMAPILIRKGALGNTRDLRVSPQHRMLLSDWQAEVLFGESEVLATAKSLVNDHSILRDEGGEVEYFHILFDSHEIVYAEGAPSESFHPGAEGWKALDMPTRNEILELFPQLAKGDFDSYGPSARASLKHKEGSLLGHSMISQTQH